MKKTTFFVPVLKIFPIVIEKNCSECIGSRRAALTFFFGYDIIVNMDNLVLIGMPSSGKSTAGVLLAKRIGYGFIDTDLIIQGEQGALLSQIIEKEGAEGFLAIEERVNAGIAAMRCVIATGGSVCYLPRAMEHLKTLGRVVYLKLSMEEVARRIPSLVKRGVVMRGNVETLEELYAERVPLYEQYADVTVCCDGQTIDETVAAIAAATGFEL